MGDLILPEGSCILQLSQGYSTLVDEDLVSSLLAVSCKWYATKRRNNWYAYCSVPKDGKWSNYYLHRIIMAAPPDLEVDHVFGTMFGPFMLNNMKRNLRLCSRAQNTSNQTKKLNATSIYKGVYWFPRNLKWVAKIHHNHKKIHLGCFLEEFEAARAYNAKAIELFGEFAKLNVV